jgi:hypothetical protein
MWRAPGSKAMRFTAVAEYGVRRVAFSWRARFPVAGSIAWLSIVDAYEETGGRMDGRVWGLVPFMRTRGDEVEVGELSRYMSETPWTPHSIIGNRDLEWVLIQSLMPHGLIDEYVLMIHPLVLGSGHKLFPDGTPLTSLRLRVTTSKGVVIATYQPADSA